MKKIIVVFLLISSFCFSQKNTFPVVHKESCSYRIHYGFINAGHATYSVTKKKEIPKKK